MVGFGVVGSHGGHGVEGCRQISELAADLICDVHVTAKRLLVHGAGEGVDAQTAVPMPDWSRCCGHSGTFAPPHDLTESVTQY